MSQYYIPMMAACKYRVWNKAVGSELLFRNDGEYNTFLERAKFHVDPIAETIAWSLLPKSFQLIVEVKLFEDLITEYEKVKHVVNPNHMSLAKFIMERIGNCLNSFVKTINNCHSREGALLNRTRWALIKDQELLPNILQVHTNPQLLGHVKKYEEWPHSSYQNFLNPNLRTNKQAEIIYNLDGIENFKLDHIIYQEKAKQFLENHGRYFLIS